jgi:hypothetical protein
MAPKRDESTDEAFRAYRAHVNRIRSEMAKLTKQMPELAGFLECADNKTRRQKKEMGRMLAKLTISLDNHRSTFEGNWKSDAKLFEKGEYLVALSKAARLERMVVILRVRDFVRRTGFKVSPPKVDTTPENPLPDAAYADSLNMWIQSGER